MQDYPDSLKVKFCARNGVGGQKPLRWWPDAVKLIDKNNGFAGNGRVKPPSVNTQQALGMGVHLVAESTRLYTGNEMMQELQRPGFLPLGKHASEWFVKRLKALLP